MTLSHSVSRPEEQTLWCFNTKL